MSEQQDMDRGYPQTDPKAPWPSMKESWVAIVAVSLGLIAAFLLIGPLSGLWIWWNG